MWEEVTIFLYVILSFPSSMPLRIKQQKKNSSFFLMVDVTGLFCRMEKQLILIHMPVRLILENYMKYRANGFL